MHDLWMSALNGLHDHVVGLHAPNPHGGEPPPGAPQLERLLRWLAWVVSGMCVAGILIVAGRMAVMHRRGEGGEHAAGLAWVAAACILIGSASAIVTVLI